MNKQKVAAIAGSIIVMSVWICAAVFEFAPDWMEIPAMLTSLGVCIACFGWVMETYIN